MMKRIRVYFVVFLFFSSSTAVSGVISYAGYSHDESSNIIVGGGLEWLQWTETLNISRNAALDKYSGDGWRLANFGEIKNLYESFFGATFEVGGSSSVFHDYRYATDSAYVTFVDMFGNTFESEAASNPGVRESIAYISKEATFEFVYVVEDSASCVSPCSEYNTRAILGNMHAVSMNDSDSLGGVALVRVASVPEPPVFLLFAGAVLAGVALNVRRRFQRAN